jgi:hypothetical protein
MKKLLSILIVPAIGCATLMDADPILRTGSTGLLNESMIEKTYEISSLHLNFDLGIEVPEDFKQFKYTTLIASKTKNTGGWQVESNLVGNKLSYCIKGPAPMSPVTMALSTPYLIVAHNKRLEISEDKNCK